MKMEKNKIARIVFLILVSCFLSACNTLPGAPSDEVSLNTPTVMQEPTMTNKMQAVTDAWKSSIHANTYSLEKGPNTYCAKCHSPLNWDDEAKVDQPPNCVSCKFAFEAEPRIAVGNPLVPEEDWKNIDCLVCHKINEEQETVQLGWLNTITGYHETVANTTELCEKCHLDNQTLRHKRMLGENAHVSFQCTDCHDPHSLRANCKNCHSISLDATPTEALDHPPSRTNEDCILCHPNAWDEHDRTIQEAGNDDCGSCHVELVDQMKKAEMAQAHSILHANVSCVACHDASGLEVGLFETNNILIPFRTTELLGRQNTKPYQSHALQRDVDCGRCHYSGNPWNLESLNTETQ